MIEQNAYERLFDVPKKRTKEDKLNELFESCYKEYLRAIKKVDNENTNENDRENFINELESICDEYKAKKMEIDNE